MGPDVRHSNASTRPSTRFFATRGITVVFAPEQEFNSPIINHRGDPPAREEIVDAPILNNRSVVVDS